MEYPLLLIWRPNNKEVGINGLFLNRYSRSLSGQKVERRQCIFGESFFRDKEDSLAQNSLHNLSRHSLVPPDKPICFVYFMQDIDGTLISQHLLLFRR